MAYTGYVGSPRGSAVLKAAVVLSVAAAFCAACIYLPRIRSLFVAQPEHFPLDLTFSNVGGLKPGAPVRVAGLDVGEVRAVDFARGKGGKPCLRVSTIIQKRARAYVRIDSIFTISTQGLLGDAYVNVSFGSDAAPAVTPGAVIVGRDPVLLEKTLERLDEAASNLKKGGALMGKVFDAALAVNNFAESAMNKLRKLKDYTPWGGKKGKTGKKTGKIEKKVEGS